MNKEVDGPFFFNNQTSQLYGFLHLPDATRIKIRNLGVVFCHPFAEEKAVSHRVLYDFAGELVRHGYPVLRFDFRGCGDSEGDFDELTLENQLSDIRRASELIADMAGVDRICLFGLRLGATYAALVAEENASAIQALMLWEPILQGGAYLDQFLRQQVMADSKEHGTVSSRRGLMSKLQESGTVDILGYPISSRLFAELGGIDLQSQVGYFQGHVLITSINKRGRLRKDLEAMEHAYLNQTGKVTSLAVADTPFWNDPNDPWRELAFWNGHESLFHHSIDWLDRLVSACETPREARS